MKYFTHRNRDMQCKNRLQKGIRAEVIAWENLILYHESEIKQVVNHFKAIVQRLNEQNMTCKPEEVRHYEPYGDQDNQSICVGDFYSLVIYKVRN